MKLRNKLTILAMCVVVSGCIKTGTKEIVMPDQELKGNRGFITGTPPAVEQPQVPKKKKILDIEVELPPVFEKTPPRYTEDKEIWGNAGYIYTGGEEKMKYIYVPTKIRKPAPAKKEVQKEELPEKDVTLEEEKSPPEEKLLPGCRVEPEYIEYKVEEGESLWTIAKKVYGDPTKWTVIYETNKDILSDPEQLRPGMVLKIPVSGETGYIK